MDEFHPLKNGVQCLHMSHHFPFWQLVPQGVAFGLLRYHWWNFFTFPITFIKWLVNSQVCSFTSYLQKCLRYWSCLWYSWIKNILHFIFLFTIDFNKWWFTNPSWDNWYMVRFQQGNMKHRMDFHGVWKLEMEGHTIDLSHDND